MRFKSNVRHIATKVGLLAIVPGLAWPFQINPCDLNNDGAVTVADVQLAINMDLGKLPCTANIDGVGVCNLIVVQRVINASLGETCLTTQTPMSPIASLSTGTLTFGSQQVGTASAVQSVTLKNTGTAPLSMTSILVSGANISDFTQTNACGSSLAINASCQVNVTFTPSASGTRTASLAFKDNASNSPQSVLLTGTGSSSSCELYVSPTGSDSHSGSLLAPWRTVQHAFNNVQPGQTVCFRGGVYPMTVSSGYNQKLNRSGVASSPIIFTNFPGEVAILHGNTRVESAYATFLGTPATAPGLIFEGPTGQPLGIIDVMYSHDVTFNHVEIRKGDYHAGLYQYGGYNIKVIGCYVHDNGRPGYINVDQGIYWDATTGGGNLIANSVVEHNVSTGIQLYPGPSEVTVEQNTIVNNGNYGMVVYGNRHTVANNIFSNNGNSADNPQMQIDTTDSLVIDSNILWSTNTNQRGYGDLCGCHTITHSIIKDPAFVDAYIHNYLLQIGSPAIGAGNTKYTQPVDKDGMKRNLPPDLGAYVTVP